jgi:hypothetical protein
MTPEDFKRLMVDKANKHREAMEMEDMSGRQAMQYVEGIVDGAMIVFGVFPDAESPDGVGMHIIKGSRELQSVMASGRAKVVAIDAVPCIQLEQSIAAEQVLGDGKYKAH